MGESTSVIQCNPEERLLIGIDPGSSTGICIIKCDTREIRSLRTLDFWATFNLFQRSLPPLNLVSQVYIEQPSMIKAFYGRHVKQLTEAGSKVPSRDRMVWNCGENAREATLLGSGLRNLGYTVFDCRPVGRKKWTSEQFQEIMNYPDRSNQHVRDAAFLVHDKQWQNVSQI